MSWLAVEIFFLVLLADSSKSYFSLVAFYKINYNSAIFY